MSRKHYRIIAAAIREALETCGKDATGYTIVRRIVSNLCTAMRADNELFSSSKFLEACGV